MTAARVRFGLKDIIYLHQDGVRPFEHALLLLHTRDEKWGGELKQQHLWSLQKLMFLGRERVLPQYLADNTGFHGVIERLGLEPCGILVPLHGPAGHFAVLLALFWTEGEKARDQAADMTTLHSFGIHYFDNMVDVLRDAQRDDSEQLSDREIECLFWCSQGKSYWETSIILGISERTVNHHMKMARLKLGAQTNAQAVGLAFTLGLFLDYHLTDVN